MWWGPKKSVHFQNREGFISEGVIYSKNRSVVPETVQYNRLIILEGCSQIGVSLYIYRNVTIKINDLFILILTPHTNIKQKEAYILFFYVI